MNGDILSYYKKENGKESKEYLGEHIERALKYIEHLEDSRIYMMAKSIEPNVNFKNIVRLAIIFHDAGKAFMRYDRGNYLSFRGHELVSAIIIDKFVRELSLDEYYYASTFAILYHHHAMNLESRRSLKWIVKDYMPNLKNTLNRFFNDGERYILEYIFEHLDSFLTDPYLNMVEHELFRRISGKNGSKVRKISYLTLNTLIATDYLSAREGRDNNTRSDFYNAIDEFYNIYIKGSSI